MVDCLKPAFPWFVCGSGFPEVYHGGPRKIRAVDIQKLQQRDPGFYGRGFYVTTSHRYAKTYGTVISAFRFKPEAVILDADLSPWDAKFTDLVEHVIGHIRKKWTEHAERRGKASSLEYELEMMRESVFSWIRGLSEYGADHVVDAIAYGHGEIVVLNHDVLHATS